MTSTIGVLLFHIPFLKDRLTDIIQRLLNREPELKILVYANEENAIQKIWPLIIGG